MNRENIRLRQAVLKMLELLMAVAVFSLFVFGQVEEDYISPVRPTASDSATIPKKGVLQLETGGDFDFDTPDYRHS